MNEPIEDVPENPLRDVTPGQFGLEGVFRSTLFGDDVRVQIEEGGTVAYAQMCADYFNSMPAHVIDDLCAASIRYCNTFLDGIGEPQIAFEQDSDVLKLVYPVALIVPPLPDEAQPVFHMELDCDWEDEHGMEWIIRGDNVLYVGLYCGENPLDDFTVKKSWNHA
jgi:hypothetical protein